MLAPPQSAISFRAPSPAESVAVSAPSISRWPSKKADSRTSSRLSTAFRRTTSDNSSTYSRPQSVVVTPSQDRLHQFAEEQPPLPRDNQESFPREVATPAAMGTSSNAPLSDWRSPWDEEAVTPEEERPMHNGVWRLGVLPSPGVETFASIGSDTTMPSTKDELQQTEPRLEPVYPETREGAPEASTDDDATPKADTPMILTDESWVRNDGHVNGHRRSPPSDISHSDVSQLHPTQYGETSRTSSVSSMHENVSSTVIQTPTQASIEPARGLDEYLKSYASSEGSDKGTADDQEAPGPRQTLLQNKLPLDHDRRFDLDSPTVPDFIRFSQPMNLDAARNLEHVDTRAVDQSQQIVQSPTTVSKPAHWKQSHQSDASRNEVYSERLPEDHDQLRHNEPLVYQESRHLAQQEYHNDFSNHAYHNQPSASPSYQQTTLPEQEQDTPSNRTPTAATPPFLETDPYAASSARSMAYAALVTPAEQAPQSSSMGPPDHRPDHRRRRSSIWGSIQRSLSRTSIQNYSEEGIVTQYQNNPGPSAEPRARDVSNKGNVLRKMQAPPVERSTSTATQPEEKKKKRFSNFGSIFRRSTSSANVETKPRNRLSKLAPQGQSSALPKANVHEARNQEYTSVPQPERSYLMEDTEHHPAMAPTSRRNSDLGRQSTSRPASRPVSGVWSESPVRQPTLPDMTPTRRLHSDRSYSQHRFSIPNVPEGYQPIDSSFQGGTGASSPARGGPIHEQSLPPQIISNPGMQTYRAPNGDDQGNSELYEGRSYDSRPQPQQRLSSTHTMSPLSRETPPEWQGQSSFVPTVKNDMGYPEVRQQRRRTFEQAVNPQVPFVESENNYGPTQAPSATASAERSPYQERPTPVQEHGYTQYPPRGPSGDQYGYGPPNYTHQGPPATHFSRPTANRAFQEQPYGYSQHNPQYPDTNGLGQSMQNSPARPTADQTPYDSQPAMHQRSLSREEAERHNLRIRQQIREQTQGYHPSRQFPPHAQQQRPRFDDSADAYGYADDGRQGGNQFMQQRQGQPMMRGGRSGAPGSSMNNTTYAG